MTEVLVGVRGKAEIFARKAVGALIRQLSNKVYLGIDKEHSIAWRVKTAEAIEAKMKALHQNRIRTQVINDFIGLRVLAGHSGCFVEMKSEIDDWANSFELVEVKVENRFNSTDESGYRAIHIDYCLSHPHDWELPPEAGIELQLTTWLQHLHGVIAHRLYYKSASPPSKTTSIFLNTLSAEFYEIDEQIVEFLSQQDKLR